MFFEFPKLGWKEKANLAASPARVLPTAPQAATESYRELLAGEGDVSLANQYVSLIHLSCFQLSLTFTFPKLRISYP